MDMRQSTAGTVSATQSVPAAASLPGSASVTGQATAASPSIRAASARDRAPALAPGFRELLRASILHQYDRFDYYRRLCTHGNLARRDLESIVTDGAYYRLPSVVSTAFKLSKGLIEDLNDLSAQGVFQVSSSTSGDPSYVLTSPDDLAAVTARYGRTFVAPGSTVGLAFAPALRILRALSRKAARVGRKAVLRMQLALEGGSRKVDEMHVTVDIDLPGTLRNRLLGRPPVIDKMPSAAVGSVIRAAEARGSDISLGGLTLLLNPYLADFRDGEFSLHGKGHVAFSGGGYSGAKGSIRGEKIDKPAFVERLSSVFGIDPALRRTNIKDVYSFTESPAQVEGYWEPDLGDFLFSPSEDCRVYIVDPETELPLRSGRGLIKVVAPGAAGCPAAANVSVLQFDTAEIVQASAGGEVESFSRIARYRAAGVSGTEGCAFKAAEIAGV